MKSKLKKTWKVRLKEDLQVRQGLAIYLWNYLNKWLRARRCVFPPSSGHQGAGEGETISAVGLRELLRSGNQAHQWTDATLCHTASQLPLAVELISLQLYV